jgi:hypothetical protein
MVNSQGLVNLLQLRLCDLLTGSSFIPEIDALADNMTAVASADVSKSDCYADEPVMIVYIKRMIVMLSSQTQTAIASLESRLH